MVVLRALVITDFFCQWSTIWRGDSLRDLSKEDFAFFKDVYNISNLSLSFCYYDDESCGVDEFGEMPF